jgi:hypothetical protein
MLGFFMSFLLLIIAIYGFEVVTRSAADEETHAVYADIAGRVANGVLTAVDVGTKRVGSTTTAQSTEILYQQLLLLPVSVHGQQYTVVLTSGQVTVTSKDGRITEPATTFNLQTPASCSTAAAFCGLSGTFLSNSNGLRVKYEYKETGTSATCSTNPVNCVTIS